MAGWTDKLSGMWQDGYRDEPMGRVQVGGDALTVRNGKTYRLPEGILRLAMAEYTHQFSNEQDYEQIQERGGLGIGEVIALLADLAERHGAKPTTPREEA